jgi:hypothetical protein
METNKHIFFDYTRSASIPGGSNTDGGVSVVDAEAVRRGCVTGAPASKQDTACAHSRAVGNTRVPVGVSLAQGRVVLFFPTIRATLNHPLLGTGREWTSDR